MTCIAGIAQGGVVYIGGDSCAASGYDYFPVADRKVFRVVAFLIGYTSSFRMGQILEYHLSVDAPREGDSDRAYMVRGFIESVRSCLKQYGYTRVSENQEEIGTFLVGYRGALYCVDSNLQVLEPMGGIAAVGCGAPYALGAMLALDGVHQTTRIVRALEIAQQCSAGVRGPFYVEELR